LLIETNLAFIMAQLSFW